MTIAERLRSGGRVFLDTAPVVYYLEGEPRRLSLMRNIFSLLDDGAFTAVTSPVTLGECLVVPYRTGQTNLRERFVNLVVHGANTVFAPIDQGIGMKAAELRARHNLTMTDALQVAVALHTACAALLTNDAILKRVSELDVIVLDEVGE